MRPLIVVFAVKPLPSAKTRIAAELAGDGSTAALVLAMLRDTAAAVTRVSAVTSLLVVSPDPRVRTVAAQCGATSIEDPVVPPAAASSDSLNHAVEHAARSVLTAAPDARVLVLQPDLPALLPRELASVLDAINAANLAAARVVVPDVDNMGTVALYVGTPLPGERPLGAAFGENSAARHEASGAHRLGGAWPGLRRDVDHLTDLAAAKRLGLGPHTAAALNELSELSGPTVP